MAQALYVFYDCNLLTAYVSTIQGAYLGGTISYKCLRDFTLDVLVGAWLRAIDCFIRTTTAFEILRIKSVAPFSHCHVFNASLVCNVLSWRGKLVFNTKFASMMECLLIRIN